MRHRAAGTPTTTTWSRAYYVQAAYRLPQFNRLLEAVLTGSSTSASTAGDAVFATVPLLDSSTRRRALRRVAVRGHQRRIPDLDARRRVAAQPRRLLPGLFHVLMDADLSPPLRARRRARCSVSWRCAPRPPMPAHTQAPDIAVVVHPDVPVDNLTIAELRRILLGDREFWASGVRVDAASSARRSRASATSPSRTSAR